MNFRQGEPTPEEMLSDPIVRVRYGGGRDRPARTRGHSETDRPDAGPANASRGTPSPCWFNAPAGQVYANLISADRHFLFHCPPHGIRCKPLDEAARRLGASSFRGQLREKWKAGQGKQHVDQIALRFGTQLAVFCHAANENRQ